MESDSRKAGDKWSSCKRVLETLHTHNTKSSNKQTSHQPKACQINLENLKTHNFLYLNLPKLKLNMESFIQILKTFRFTCRWFWEASTFSTIPESGPVMAWRYNHRFNVAAFSHVWLPSTICRIKNSSVWNESLSYNEAKHEKEKKRYRKADSKTIRWKQNRQWKRRFNWKSNVHSSKIPAYNCATAGTIFLLFFV